MLSQDFKALPEMYRKFKNLQEKATALKEGKGRKFQAEILSCRATAADFFVIYLQELLCRAHPGKAVKFLTILDVIDFTTYMKSYEDKLEDTDFVIKALETVTRK